MTNLITKLAKPSKPLLVCGKHANRLLPCGDTVVEPLHKKLCGFVGFVIKKTNDVFW